MTITETIKAHEIERDPFWGKPPESLSRKKESTRAEPYYEEDILMGHPLLDG